MKVKHQAKPVKFRIGTLVEVRPKEEILRTLDDKAELDGMPFMPEMLQFCGKRFRVYKSAHKTCDYSTTHPHRLRKLKDCVHLETRCSGEAHDNCQAGCLLYWKLAWLKPVADDPRRIDIDVNHLESNREDVPRSDETALHANTRCSDASGTIYRCQTTQIPAATSPLPWWDVRQYFEDYWSGNVTFRRLIDALVYSTYFHIGQSGIGLGRPMRWLYNSFRWLWGGSLFPRTTGSIPEGAPTPTVNLGLQPGELVRVKTQAEILKTVTVTNQNRGMHWDAELVPYCGKTFRVRGRVNRLIDEKTSRMVVMKNPCIVLESVVCQARYSQCRMLCPKSMFPYWREIWLERANEKNG